MYRLSRNDTINKMMIVNGLDSTNYNQYSIDEYLQYMLDNTEMFIKETRYFSNAENCENFTTGYLNRTSWHQKIPYVKDDFYKQTSSVFKYNFVNDDKKALLLIDGSIFHFLENTLPTIFFLYELDNSTTFIISCDNKNNFIINSLKQVFLKYKINHIFLSSEFLLAINNFYEDPYLMHSQKTVDVINKYFLNNEKNNKPFKKVYLSRKLSIQENIYRVQDEELLEQYFQSKGFEIIYNENFNSIQDQINFYKNVAVLVSPTGTGQTSMLYMQPNQVVIEIITPILHKNWNNKELDIVKRGFYSLDSFYYVNFAYCKNHTYLGIASKYYANQIIDSFESNKHISDIINSNFDRK